MNAENKGNKKWNSRNSKTRNLRFKEQGDRTQSRISGNGFLTHMQTRAKTSHESQRKEINMKLEYKNVFNKGLRKWNRVLFFLGFRL